MTPQRLTSIVALAVALAGAGLGCGDDKPSADAATTGGAGGATGGRGGTGGTGGSAGRGGTGGTSTGGTTAGSGGSSDASSTGGTAGTGTGGAGGTAGTGGGADAGADTVQPGADMALPIDMAVDQPLPVDLPPDTQATGTVMVNDCAQFMCPQLTSIASQCQASETTCLHSKTGDQTNYCHSNGVKKVAHTTSTGGTGYMTTLDVYKANSGDDCYTLAIQGTGGASDMQNWTFKSPAGVTLATATWRASDGRLVIRCDNVDYVIGDVGCPGTDGQPDDTGAECPAGSCSEP